MFVFKKIKPLGRVIQAFNGFAYDFKRFYLYAAWRCNMKDADEKNYHIVKIYHALEKSMCIKNRRVDAGWTYANMLLDILKKEKSKPLNFHEKAALNVLYKFTDLEGNRHTSSAEKIRQGLKQFEPIPEELHGCRVVTIEDYNKGILQKPEDFFLNRYSLREFKKEKIDIDLIERAVFLALKSPSACNRQAWHVYHSDNKEVMSTALKKQSGNRGFGDEIPNLMIISSDLKAFMPSQERYQHWIDGGMFSMSIIYALHSLGVASCCLNWSTSPADDRLIRSTLNIKDNHTVVMMLAIGWPNEENKVCVSARRPLEEVFSKLTLRNES